MSDATREPAIQDIQKLYVSVKVYPVHALDRPTLVRLIQKIEVGEKYQADDHMERDINIYYNFVCFVEL